MGRGDQQEHLAAGALEAPEALTPRRRRRIVEEWIANLDYEQQPYGPREAVHTKHLMREHGPVPTGGFDPMLDLPDDVAERDPGEQLACLVRAYGREIGQGYGLALMASKTAQGDGERRLALHAQRRVQQTMRQLEITDEAEALEVMMRIYRAREAQMHWACCRLGWPSDWVLETIRATVLRRAEESGPMPDQGPDFPSPDPEYDADLEEIHGPPPPGFDPLADLPEGIAEWDFADQLDALEEAYRDLARAMLAQEEMAEGHNDGRFAREVLAQLEEEAIRAGEEDETAALYRWQRLRSAEEAQLHWAAQELEISTSALIGYLKDRARLSL